MYRRTQVGWASLVILAVVLPVVLIAEQRAPAPVAAIAPAILVACGVFLATLTVQVDENGVSWWFTGGLWRRRLRWNEIRDAHARRIVPLGFGIRTDFAGTTAYLVSGRGAVAIDAVDGRRIIVGSDDPAGLERAIRVHLTR
jgi:hypothetical protein